MSRLLARIVAVVSAAVVACGGMTGLAAASTAVAQNPSTGLLAYNNNDLAAADTAHYGYVVINAAQGDQIPAIRAASPGIKILIYKNAASTADYATHSGVDDAELPNGMGYLWARANHPDWFLTGSNGQPVQFDDYPGLWFMDMGNRDYQNTWAANVIADVKAMGADGVMLDDVNAQYGGHLPSGVTIPRYPTDADYAGATESFLANVGPQLHNAGLLDVANIMIQWSPTWEPLYQRWVSDVDGRLFEYWVKPGDNSSYARFGDNDWDYQMQQAADVIGAGKVLLTLTYGDMADLTTQIYARASFLMAWDGGNSASIWVPSANPVNPWTPQVSASIGLPTGARTQLPSGVWQRTYSGGLVLVNASRTATRTVTLPGSFVTAGGDSVDTVTLAPMTGAVLAASGATATPAAVSSATPDLTPASQPSTPPALVTGDTPAAQLSTPQVSTPQLSTPQPSPVQSAPVPQPQSAPPTRLAQQRAQARALRIRVERAAKALAVVKAAPVQRLRKQAMHAVKAHPRPVSAAWWRNLLDRLLSAVKRHPAALARMRR